MKRTTSAKDIKHAAQLRKDNASLSKALGDMVDQAAAAGRRADQNEDLAREYYEIARRGGAR